MTRHLGFLKATAISLSAALCFRERGNIKKLRVYVWERQLESCTGHCPTLLALSTGSRENHFILLVDLGFMFHI